MNKEKFLIILSSILELVVLYCIFFFFFIGFITPDTLVISLLLWLIWESINTLKYKVR